jgi:hypothetical protein
MYVLKRSTDLMCEGFQKIVFLSLELLGLYNFTQTLRNIALRLSSCDENATTAI